MWWARKARGACIYIYMYFSRIWYLHVFFSFIYIFSFFYYSFFFNIYWLQRLRNIRFQCDLSSLSFSLSRWSWRPCHIFLLPLHVIEASSGIKGSCAPTDLEFFCYYVRISENFSMLSFPEKKWIYKYKMYIYYMYIFIETNQCL